MAKKAATGSSWDDTGSWASHMSISEINRNDGRGRRSTTGSRPLQFWLRKSGYLQNRIEWPLPKDQLKNP